MREPVVRERPPRPTVEQDNRHPRDIVLWMEAKVEALERKLAEKAKAREDAQ